MPISREIARRLSQFAEKHNVHEKGPLSVVLTLSRRWQQAEFPISTKEIRTPRGGQVKGLGGAAVQSILTEHGILRRLASEGGRTSRGSLDLALKYSEFINELHRKKMLNGPQELKEFESWWIEKIQAYFDRQGFEVHLDPAISISAIVSAILNQAKERQKQLRGSTLVGTVLEHLVGAKLELAMGEGKVHHKIASTADESSGASGDFEIEETVFHVTSSPTEALLLKCESNIHGGKRPVIVCPSGFRQAACSLADSAGLENRIEVYEAQEFISMNINEWSGFSSLKLLDNAIRFVDKYNEIIDAVEKNPSLRIERKSR